jgi:hypothetical protein
MIFCLTPVQGKALNDEGHFVVKFFSKAYAIIDIGLFYHSMEMLDQAFYHFPAPTAAMAVPREPGYSFKKPLKLKYNFIKSLLFLEPFTPSGVFIIG